MDRDLKLQLEDACHQYKAAIHQQKIEKSAADTWLRKRKRQLQEEQKRREEREKILPSKTKLLFWRRVEDKKDDLILAICVPFERKAIDIRYKKSDRPGWEANKVVDDATRLVNWYADRVDSGKKLKPSSIELLLKIKQAMGIIINFHIGTKIEEAKVIRNRATNIIEKGTNKVVIPDLTIALNDICEAAQNTVVVTCNSCGKLTFLKDNCCLLCGSDQNPDPPIPEKSNVVPFTPTELSL